MEQQLHRACHRTKSKQKQNQIKSHLNWPRTLFFDLTHKQRNGIIKGWLHSLTPESIGRFLANNILMFDSAWCPLMAQIPFPLTKKIKIGSPEHPLPTPLPPSKWTSYVYHPLQIWDNFYTIFLLVLSKKKQNTRRVHQDSSTPLSPDPSVPKGNGKFKSYLYKYLAKNKTLVKYFQLL